ncbi:MAG: 50S ribosomal protein L33 [Bacilli bacterium]|jgi:large subunit ribosomal protein L33|nr:50S ribosomal protein L33 [Bacilli bacterium]MCH4210507.1 50S ribosomal protein L33 [Bacilli bacterium]MCH4228269.1 50S ribosomal protein L33 [Bacilli bacterium]MCH4277703.1 50S ribosomal protein L33 [Bacilli bacterium]MCI2054690.1 50S ribosomal protein L33 [Bacilli bacterium]
MAKSKRDNITLKCSICGEQNYISTRNKKSHPNKMEIMKFCPRCNKMTLHKEAK